jgi:hypothetical protein
MKLVLERFLTGEHGTFGQLSWEGLAAAPVLFTCEDEWLDNQRAVSCIPPGVYVLKPRRYHGGGYDTYEVTGVPQRDAILIHAGNTEEDTKGCVLTGMSLGVVTVAKDEETGKQARKLAVLQSRKAHELFMRTMGAAPSATLTVRWFGAE